MAFAVVVGGGVTGLAVASGATEEPMAFAVVIGGGVTGRICLSLSDRSFASSCGRSSSSSRLRKTRSLSALCLSCSAPRVARSSFSCAASLSAISLACDDRSSASIAARRFRPLSPCAEVPGSIRVWSPTAFCSASRSEAMSPSSSIASNICVDPHSGHFRLTRPIQTKTAASTKGGQARAPAGHRGPVGQGVSGILTEGEGPEPIDDPDEGYRRG